MVTNNRNNAAIKNPPVVVDARGNAARISLQAKGQIRLAVSRLAGKYPFHARVIERFVVRPARDVQTMAVTVDGDDVPLFYDARFVLGIRLDELVGVLLHEVHHVVFGHVLTKPAEFPDWWARVVAQEVTVNEFVTEPLPGTPILLAHFPRLPPMESTAHRYARLARTSIASRPPIFWASGELVVGSVGGDAEGAGRVVTDNHAIWATGEVEPERAEAAIRSLLHDAATDVGAADVPEHLRAALAAMGIGRVAGNGRYDLAGTGSGSVPWTSVLRRHAGRLLSPRHDLRRPPRRCPQLVGLVPGKSRATHKPHVMAVIDTSGSITPDLLEQISAELARLANSFAVTVVECDAAVHAVYPYRPLKSVSGRGGTDFRPPLEPAFLHHHHPDLIVYFTDGLGPAPTRPPPVPVIWCLTTQGQKPAAWGRLIQMDQPG